MLDLSTLLVAYSMTTVILSLALLLAARSQRRFPGLELWSLGGVLVGTVPLQVSAQGALYGQPSPLTASVAIIGGMACLSAGMARYTGQPFRYRFYLGLAVTWLGCIVVALTTPLPYKYCTIVMCLLVTAEATETALQILHRRPLLEIPAHRITAFLFLLMAVTGVFRAGWVYLFGLGGPSFGFASLQPFGLLGFQAMHTAMGASLLVMVWARLDRELQAHVSALEEQLARDPLTGALNRRGLRSCAEPLIERAARHALPVSVICLDIDHFKRVNDTFGHDVGDEVLKALVACVRDHLRSEDQLSRLGGEEFAVVLPETALEGAMALAERLRTAAAALKLRVDASHIQFTCSFGVAERLPLEDDLAALLARADHALYQAKRAGRNRVREALVQVPERSSLSLA